MSRRHPLSLAALTVIELTPEDMVSCAAQAGFSHVGLRPIPATPNEPAWDFVRDKTRLREIMSRLHGTGIKVLDIEILRLKPETCVADFKPVLEVGAELGARFALVAGNDPDEARLKDNLARLCDLAEPLGIAPYLEPMPWTDVKSFEQGARIAAATGRAHAGVLVDPIHFDRAGSSIARIAQVPPQRLQYMQLCDAPAEQPATLEGLLRQARAERLLPGQGGLDLAGLLRAMPVDIPISVEIPMLTLAKYLRAEQCAKIVGEAVCALLDGVVAQTVNCERSEFVRR